MLPFSQLRQNARKNLRDLIPLAKPFSLTVDPSSVCNFSCIQCYHGAKNIRDRIELRTLKMTEFKKIIDELKVWKGPKLKVLKLYNCGEPLLNRDFISMLRYAREADIADRIDLTSNCALLTPVISEKMVEYGLDYLRASIYSPLQQNFERITQNKMDVEEIFKNLACLKEIKMKYASAKPFVAVKMFQSLSKEENDLFLSTYSSVADEIFTETLHNFTGDLGMDLIDSYYGSNGIVNVQELRNIKRVCPWPFMTLTVQSNGDVNVCCIDWSGYTNVGNVFTQSLRDIWEGPRLYEFRKMQIEGRKIENTACSKCNVYLSDDFTIDNIDGITVELLPKPRLKP